MKYSILQLLLLLVGVEAGAQPLLRYDKIPLPEDQRINAVGDLVQSADGYHWFATNDGLYRYNGYDFLKLYRESGNFFLPENDLKQLELGPSDSTLWLLSNDRNLYSFNTNTLEASTAQLEGLVDKIAWICSAAKWGLCITTDKGDIYRFRKGQLTKLNKRSYGESILVQFIQNDIVWLKVESRDKILAFDIETGEFLQEFAATGVWRESEGVAFVTRGGKVYSMGKDGTLVLRQQINTEGYNVNQVAEGASLVWVADFHGKLFVKSAHPDSLFHEISLDVREKLGQQKYLAIYADSDDRLLIGTSKLVYRLCPAVGAGIKAILSTPLHDEYEVGRSTRAIYEMDSAHVLICSYGDFMMYNRLRDSVYPYPLFSSGVALGVPFMSMTDFDGKWLAGVTEGASLSAINLPAQTYRKIEPKGKKITQYLLSIEPYRNGFYLLGGNKGLYLFNPQDSVYSQFGNPELHFSCCQVWDIQPFYDEVFALATDNGVYLFDESGVLQHYSSLGGRSFVQVHCIGRYSGYLYAGTELGLVQVSRDGKVKLMIEGYNIFSQVREENRLWLGTDDGLIVFYPETGAWSRFTTADGLSSNEFNRKSAVVLRDGTLLLGGINGVNQIDSRKLLRSEGEEPVFFSQVSLDGETGTTLLPHRRSVVEMTQWKELVASFAFEDDLLLCRYNLWVDYGEGWEVQPGPRLQLSADQVNDVDSIKVKLQFASGNFSNELYIAAPATGISVSYLPFMGGLFSLGLIWFVAKRRTDPSAAERREYHLPESEIGRYSELLFVKPTGEVEEGVLQKLYKIQKAIVENPERKEFNACYLTDITHTSERQLYRIFKEAVGLTPLQFVKKTRLRYSLYLLYSGKYKTISEVADAAGFQKASYYSRLFREEYSRSPKSFLGKS